MSSVSRLSTYRTGLPVHRLFEDHARQTPTAPAVRCGSARLTYGELDQRANRLARHLRAAGLAPGGLVAVSMGRRTTDLVVAMLAVLKAGGAYVPVEPSNREPVLRHLLADADPFAVLTHERDRVRLADGTGTRGRRVICLDTEAAGIGRHPGDPLDEVPGAELACVFYTSGSTGLPKGAMIEHRNLLNAYFAWEEVYRLSPEDRHLQTTTFEFDVFTADWIRALCSGGTLVMAQRNFTLDRSADIAGLHRLIVDEAITVMECNVHTARRLHAHLGRIRRNRRPSALRLLVVGAEKWYLDEHIRLQEILGPGVRCVNAYGVAEATVDSAYFELPRPEAIEAEHVESVSVIGVPFPNSRVYVLREDGSPATTGEPGEICVGGPGVGRGYLGRPDLTAERFPDADFDPDGRVYRTGDVGRIRHDGLVEYIGRMDFRVEIGSERIEVAEIEAVLRRHPSVEDCLVTAVEVGPRAPQLVAYAAVGADGAASVDAREIRSWLAERLPPVMVPSVVVPLRTLPRTRAGKVDRHNLPLPTAAGSGTKGSKRAGFGAAKTAFGGFETGFAGGKGGPGGAASDAGGVSGRATAWVVLTALFTLLAALLTDPLWPSSTDVSLVPDPWARLFQLLYACEWLSFGVGMAFLFLGRPLLLRRSPGRGWAAAAHVSIAWLLAAWWPQDNWYRLAGRTDWPRQAALVYGFNVSLMLAAVVVARYFAKADDDHVP